MELMIVLIIGLLVLGPKRLPELGRSVGHGLREFKRSVTGANDDADLATVLTPGEATDAGTEGSMTSVPAR